MNDNLYAKNSNSDLIMKVLVEGSSEIGMVIAISAAFRFRKGNDTDELQAHGTFNL